MTNTPPVIPPTLPAFSGRGRGRNVYPAPETRIGRAWGAVWDRLRETEEQEYVYGGDLAHVGARAARPHLADVTVLNLMNHMVKAGILEADKREVHGPGGFRRRNFYRIKR